LNNNSRIFAITPHKGTSALQDIEYTRHLDIIDIGPQDDGDYCLKIDLQAIHLSRAGLVHGGMVFTMLDAALARAVINQLPRGYSSPTIEMKINYFRPASAGELSPEVGLSTRASNFATPRARSSTAKASSSPAPPLPFLSSQCLEPTTV
jgi:uncharacterized protein (TIGR00369 family)